MMASSDVRSVAPAMAVPVTCFVTVLLALLSWGSFTSTSFSYLGPILVAGMLVVGTGISARLLRVHGTVVVLLQLLLGTIATSLLVVQHPFPVTAGGRALVVAEMTRAYEAFNPFDLPMSGAPVAAYLVPGGVAAVLLADVLAVSLRRPPMMGLVVLGVFTVPFSIIGAGGWGGVSWIVFVLTATAFLVMLRLDRAQQLGRWGRRLDEDLPATPAAGPTVIGVSAVVIAVIAPAWLPSPDVTLPGMGPGDGNGPLRVINPTVGLYDDLRRQSNQVMVSVTPVDGDTETPPSYLRIGALTKFTGTEWTSGNRDVPSDHTGVATFEPPMSDETLLGEKTTYQMKASPRFQSSWLPVFTHPLEVTARGPWRYDEDTLDFMSTEGRDHTVAGKRWRMTAAPVEPSQERLLAAGDPGVGAPPGMTELPLLPDEIEEIALERTAGQDRPFTKAVALQNWFRHSGEFTYSLERDVGADSAALLDFLTDNKIGYCQQYATAMAVLARELGIPARVAFGFLGGDQDEDGVWQFRGRDLHAWPELWFEDIGWVRFEPTPAAADTREPGYTRGALGNARNEPEAPIPTAGTGEVPVPNRPQREAPDTAEVTDTGTEDSGSGTVWFGLGIVAVVGMIVLAAPAVIRRRRRTARLAGDAEAGWTELGDTAIDLGRPWSGTRSPREEAASLAPQLQGLEPMLALQRIVAAVERNRYAEHRGTAAVGDDVRLVSAALREHADRRARRRARLWPASVFRRPTAPAGDGPATRSERELISS
jgi:transglutaminase-like putative cysteine protease